MKTVLLVILVAAAVYLAYCGIRFAHAVSVSKKLVERAVPYEKASDDHSVSLLILGDSTAVGVGADSPADSVAGRLSVYLGATSVENYAKSGAVVADLPGQIAQAKLARYRLIVVQIGANDIIRFHPLAPVAANLQAVLKTLPASDQTVLIMAGNVGGATLFPPFMRPFYTSLTMAYHQAFTALAAQDGVTYVNLYIPPAEDPFTQDSGSYLAADGLHPSSKGYGLWFDRIAEALASR